MDNNLLDLKTNETIQEDIANLEKLTQSYLLLKKRISGTHELIKQYNDKLKECERSKQELDGLNKEVKKITCNYNSTLAKVIKLELQNTEYKKNIKILTTQVSEHNIKAAADKQHIQQLICKIKDIEANQNDKIMQYDLEKSSLQVKVKELEQELKNVKKSYDTKMKKMEKKVPIENENKVKLKDAAINTILTKDIIMQKPEVRDKSVLTNEFYNVKNNLYPVFCGKCEILLEPPPIEKICKVMSNSCPKLIEKISSPIKRSQKPSSMLQMPADINSERYRTESLPTLSSTPAHHLQNQSSHVDFIPTSLLHPHTISLNPANCYNNNNTFPSASNQGTYYIGPTAHNPLSMINLSTANQNGHCESMAASSLPIITSLQKKIDTLENKIKKKLKKRKSDQNNSCQHYHHQNPPHISTLNINNIEIEDIKVIQNSVECSKSVGGETDSGILSDSIESGKLMQLKADTGAKSKLTMQQQNKTENATEIKSSKQSKSCSDDHNIGTNESPMETTVESSNTLNTLSKSDEYIEEIIMFDVSSVSDEYVEESNTSDTLSELNESIENTSDTSWITEESIEKTNRSDILLKPDERISKTNSLNILSKSDECVEESNTLDMTKSYEKDTIRKMSIPNIKNSLSDLENKNSFERSKNNYSKFDTKPNSCLRKTIKTKPESNQHSKLLKRKHGNNCINVKGINGIDKMSQQGALNSNSRSSINTLETSDVKEMNLNTEKLTNNVCKKEEDFTTEYNLKPYHPIIKLQQYVNEIKCIKTKRNKNQSAKLSHVRSVVDKFVEIQLQRLIDSDWESSIHWDVIKTLQSTCSACIIAKGIIDFLSKEVDHNHVLDNTYTPPAPLMAKAQQRISALLVDLEKSKPTIIQIVQAGIEYKLFRLNQPIESLSRMYTVLARIRKDREKVRIFCCDALYCLGINAVIILYTVLTCWPEVFPNNDTNAELLPRCMAHLILEQQGIDFPKLNALKNLISIYYKYPMGTLSADILKELLMAIQKNSHSNVETAIILLAKREGTEWAYKNVVKGALLSMIVNNKLPNTYRAFSLLGNLMRVFPIEDKDNAVGEIVEQLSDLIISGEGSDEQKEGVISALLSLARHKFQEVVPNLLKWTPAVPLCDRTSEQIRGLVNIRDIVFWQNYLRKRKYLWDTLK
ncbi:hypothetical protein WN48_09129 [Eufriesea mexicana]|nr:hypothetical protein WN48_09129 [Eufriesea mexicana]